MPILPPLGTTPDVPVVVPDLARTCDACGLVIADGSKAINIMITIGVAGDPNIAPFQCPQEEHWACNPDHLLHIAVACLREHIHPLLKFHHTKHGVKVEKGNPIKNATDTNPIP